MSFWSLRVELSRHETTTFLVVFLVLGFELPKKPDLRRTPLAKNAEILASAKCSKAVIFIYLIEKFQDTCIGDNHGSHEATFR